jgi:hypothetical protein
MINTADNENKIDFVLDLKDYIPVGEYKLYQVDGSGKKEYIENVYLPNHNFTEVVESNGIKVLELEPL